MEEHRHDGNCFEKTRTLVCGLEEHVHSDVCYGKPGGDPEADIESEDDWIDSISEIKAGASPAENLISVADTQLGYTESDKNFVVTESGEKKGYTRYGAWRGEPYDDWNCSFASFCVYYAGGRDLPIGSVCAEWLEAMNGYEKVDTIDPKGLVPESGDIVFLDTDGDLSVDRAALVCEIKYEEASEEETAARIVCIEGDVEGEVSLVEYEADDAALSCIIRLPEEWEEPEEVENENTIDIEVSESSDIQAPLKAMPALRAEAVQDNTATLTVRKDWSDTWENHSPVTVTLLKTGADGVTVSTGRTLTLSDENGWSATFDDLELEDGEFKYSVVENEMENYFPQYGVISKSEVQSDGYWVPSSDTSLISGKTYVFRTGNYVLNQSTSYLTRAGIGDAGGVTVNGVTYQSSLIGVPDSAKWYATEMGSGFKLYNGSRYISGAGCTTNEGSAAAMQYDSNGRIMQVSSSRYLRWMSYWNRYSLDSANNAERFQLYELVVPNNDGNDYETVIKNIRIFAQQGEIDPDPKLHKEIDYLGDDGENPDTTLTGEDYYRLYLDVIGSHQPVDLLIVADMSVSMGREYSDGMDRQTALDKIVNGTIISGSGANAERDDDGIIYKFLSLHKDNKVAVTGFSGGYNEVGQTYEDTKEIHNPITMPWSARSDMPNGGATPKDCYARVIRQSQPGGTNYTAALMRAGELLSDPSVTDDGHLKVMVFLTDGEPNRYIDSQGRIAVDSSPFTNTRNFYVKFIETHPNLISYIVGISPDANSGSAYNLLSGIANDAHLTYYPADNASQLESALKSIIDRSKFSLVEIIDELSADVEYYTEQPDVKVTRTDADGNVTTIWEYGAPTEFNVDNDGNQILQGVTFKASEDGKRTVRATFNPECLLDGENTFVLSYNVKVTDSAKDKFISGGYDAVGDDETDFGENETSSGSEGFRSNDRAYITYTAYDVGHVTDYPHPVIQVAGVVLKIRKISATDSLPLAGAEFDLYISAHSGDTGSVLIPGTTNSFGKKTNSESIVTGEDGSSGVLTLPSGRWYFVETAAPAGYNPITKPIAFDVEDGEITVVTGELFSESAIVVSDTSTGEIYIEIENNTTFTLPETGGNGTWMYYFVGGVIAAFSAAHLAVRHIRERKNRKHILP
jgi:hypothetical protein